MSLSNSEKKQRRQWLGFLSGPAAWSVYFVVVYVLDEAACKLTLLAPTAVFPVATVLTVLTLGLLGYGVYLSYQAWQQGNGEGSGRFLGWTGLLMGGLFILMTLAIWIATWVLMPC